MIDVKDSEPKIFITCDIYREKDLCDEVLNVLFSYNVEAECRWFYGKGFSIVYLRDNVDVRKAVRYIVSRHVRGYWVIPIDMVCRTSYEDITRCVVESILMKGYTLPLNLVGICRKRGDYIDSCSNLLRYIGEAIESLGIATVDFKSFSYVLRLEVVYDTTFVSIYRRDEESMFRVTRPR